MSYLLCYSSSPWNIKKSNLNSSVCLVYVELLTIKLTWIEKINVYIACLPQSKLKECERVKESGRPGEVMTTKFHFLALQSVSCCAQGNSGYWCFFSYCHKYHKNYHKKYFDHSVMCIAALSRLRYCGIAVTIPLRGRPFTLQDTVGLGLPVAEHLMSTSEPIMLSWLSGLAIHWGGSGKTRRVRKEVVFNFIRITTELKKKKTTPQ